MLALCLTSSLFWWQWERAKFPLEDLTSVMTPTGTQSQTLPRLSFAQLVVILEPTLLLH
jgi:hypothetical protein